MADYERTVRVSAIRWEDGVESYLAVCEFLGRTPSSHLPSESVVITEMSSWCFVGKLRLGDWLVREGKKKARVMTDKRFREQFSPVEARCVR